jgi:hypothetical protein
MHCPVSTLVLGLAIPVALAQTQPIPQPALTTTEAAQHVGENRTVCGAIVNTHIAESSHGTPTFIDIDQAWPNQVFDLVIWGDKKDDIGNFPKAGKICASGKIVLYKGHPEIFLEDWHSWYVPTDTQQRASVP